jgi:acid phosphatase type 7
MTVPPRPGRPPLQRLALSLAVCVPLLACAPAGPVPGVGTRPAPAGTPGAAAGSPDGSRLAPAGTRLAPAAKPGTVTIAAVGDMNPPGNRSPLSPTGRVAASVAATRTTLVFGLGDYQYYTGTCTALVGGFDRLWGRVLPRMFHIAGPTHDWTSIRNEQGYRRHFAGTCPGQRTGPSLLVRARRASVGPGDFWSRDVGAWHLVGLPTGLWRYAPVRARAMTRTLALDLASARARGKHVLVAYHDPYFTSRTDRHGADTLVKPWLALLQRYHVRITLSGSQHNYERTCPVLLTGVCTPAAGNGTTGFNVSTGGIDLRPFKTRPRFVAQRFSNTFGWLALALRPDGSFVWRYHPVVGRGSDGGSRPAPRPGP